MKLQKTTLLLLSIMFTGFGIAFLLFPAELLGLAEIQVTHPTGKMEIRAFYGGLEIGLGVFFLISRHPQRIRDGLRLGLLILAGILLGRVTGAAVDGVQGNYIWYVLPFEGGGFVLCLLSLQRT